MLPNVVRLKNGFSNNVLSTDAQNSKTRPDSPLMECSQEDLELRVLKMSQMILTLVLNLSIMGAVHSELTLVELICLNILQHHHQHHLLTHHVTQLMYAPNVK